MLKNTQMISNDCYEKMMILYIETRPACCGRILMKAIRRSRPETG